MDSDGPCEPCIRSQGSKSPTCGGGNFKGKNGRPFWTIGTLCSELCINSWTNQDAIWDADSGGPKEPCIRWGCTLALSGEYDWTIHKQRQCNYLDHLLLFWSNLVTSRGKLYDVVINYWKTVNLDIFTLIVDPVNLYKSLPKFSSTVLFCEVKHFCHRAQSKIKSF